MRTKLEQTPLNGKPAFSLEVDDEGRAWLVTEDHPRGRVHLGPKGPAMEVMAEFLSAQDFGE